MKVQHTESIRRIPDYCQVLKTRRERMGYKQSEIAEKLGISAMGLSHFENGRRNPSVEMIEKWAQTMGAEIWLEIRNK